MKWKKRGFAARLSGSTDRKRTFINAGVREAQRENQFGLSAGFTADSIAALLEWQLVDLFSGAGRSLALFPDIVQISSPMLPPRTMSATDIILTFQSAQLRCPELAIALRHRR